MYRSFLKKILFLSDPERAHRFVFYLLTIPWISKLLGRWYHFEHPALERKVFGLTFKNPVGLAAGFDKDACLYRQLGDLGFGFIEIGTVTPRGQVGNPRPRLFRLSADEALINRMGFNNEGLEKVARRLKSSGERVLIGGNIGKNKHTPNSAAYKDYEDCFQTLYPLVDYFVVNVSSPNTPNLRALQDKAPLTHLLRHLQTLKRSRPVLKPILLKISPDLNDKQLDDIIDIVITTGIDGVIATNTTISRENLCTAQDQLEQIGSGGLSGKPLAKRSTEVIRYLHQKSGGKFPIIGVGGIHTPKDALEKLDAGASLVQLYTGFIYEGPALIQNIKKALLQAAQHASALR